MFASMACLTNARFVLYDSLVSRSRTLLRTVDSASLTPPSNNIALRSLRRRFTSVADADSELFNYTSGRWMQVFFCYLVSLVRTYI